VQQDCLCYLMERMCKQMEYLRLMAGYLFVNK